MMRFLLADDHGLFREGVKLIFKKMDPEIDVIEADTFENARDAIPGGEFDVVFLDLKMPGMRGMDSVQEICEQASNMPVVVLSGTYQRKDVLSAIDLGAQGFIPKTLGSKAMINAINLVLSGEKYLPSVIMDDSFDDDDGEDIEDAMFSMLTVREREVLKHLVDGHSNKAIANLLNLQEVTVRAHLKGVFRKLNVTSRTQAVGLALRRGFAG